jgi:hypothetical protein
MKTSEAIQKASSAAELARLLGITRQSINDWKEDVPQGRLYQLMVLKPEWFPEMSKRTRSKAAKAV